MLDDALNTILRPRGRRVLGCWQTISNAPRPNSNGLRGSQAAPPPTTLRKNIAAKMATTGLTPAVRAPRPRRPAGNVENDVPTRTIYGHRSVVANETTTLGYGSATHGVEHEQAIWTTSQPIRRAPDLQIAGALSMGTTPRRSHAERPPRRCQLCVAPLVSPPLSVMLTADSYPTLRRRDDTTTATENCVCEIRTPEQSRQQGDDAGMEMTTLDTGGRLMAWLGWSGSSCEDEEDESTGARLRATFELEGADVHSAPSRGMSRSADHTAARLAVRVLPAPLSSAVSWHTGGMGADVPYRRRGIDSRPLPLPPMRSLRRLAIQGDTEKRSPAEERNF
ncbi:hypothetical protein BJ912DRAFT_1133469 [Pholiota molesta]|nr:hypothetical protein BJ912DRAFT_1133469 [Pholiota molesta]